jgi:hypothetical protein
MINQERIIQLLGSGLSAEIVATAVGCDASYISQLLSNDEFAKKVTELRVISLQAATKRDNKWDTIEDKLLDKLESSVEYIMKPRDILAALATVNAAKRRGATAQESVTINNTVVNLSLPPRAVHNFVVNTTNQVIGVNEQSLLTMPSSNVKSMLAARTKQAALGVTDTNGAQTPAMQEKLDGSKDAGYTEAKAEAEGLRTRLRRAATGLRANDL